MLRRVGKAISRALLVLGAFILLWIPFSYLYVAYVAWPRGSKEACIFVEQGVLVLVSAEYFVGPHRVHWVIASTSWHSLIDGEDVPRFWASFVRYTIVDFAAVSIPLWLLAFLCLAWPVTSFLLSRRCRGQGFEVDNVRT